MSTQLKQQPEAECQQFLISTAQGQLFLQAYVPSQQIKSTQACPIVLLHDSLGSVALWRDFPQQLAEQTQRTVYAYDRLGFGQSSAAPQALHLDFIALEAEQGFKALIDYLQLQHFIVMGHSVGGGMACHVAAHYPLQCQALISIAAQSKVESKTLAGIRQAKAMFAEVGQLQRLVKYHGDKAQWVLDAWTETWCDPQFADWVLDDAIQALSCPSLILHGELDEYGSITQAEQFAKLSPHRTQVEILAGLHHMPHKEDEALVLTLIQQFVKTLD